MENFNYEWLAFIKTTLLIMSAVGGILAVAISIFERISSLAVSRISKGFTLCAKPFDMARKAVLLLLLVPFWIFISFFTDAPKAQGVKLSPIDFETTAYSTQANATLATPSQTGSDKNTSTPIITAKQLEYILLSIWISGALFLLAKTSVSGLGFFLRLKKLKARGAILPVTDEKAISLLSECCKKLKLKTPPTLYSCSMLCTPILTRFNGHAIIIPTSFEYNLSEAVLLHELNHLKSKDLLYKLFLRLACCIHWFNPAVWILSHEAQKCCELSCDEKTCALLDITGKKEYVEAIFSSVSPNKQYTKQALCLGGGESDKKEIKKRIEVIMKTSRNKKSVLIIAIALATMLLVGGGVICFATAPSPPDVSSVFNNSSDTKDNTASSTTQPKETNQAPIPTSVDIVLDNGNAGAHEIQANSEAVYYSKAGTSFAVTSGEKIELKLKFTDRNFPYGQGVEIGYIHNKNRSIIFDEQVKSEASAEFSPLFDGEVLFYVKCNSSDSILAESFSVIRPTLTPLPLYGKTIVLDPGHGGNDNGTTVAGEDALEKTYNLFQAQELAQAFIANGAEVIMTRNDDTAVSNEDRVEIAKEINPDLFLSIHHNSMGTSPSVSDRNGLFLATDLFKGSKENKKYTDALNEELSPLFRSDTILFEREKTFIVVRETEYPAVHMELGYMSNPEDLAQIQSPDHRSAVAAAIVNATTKLLTEQAA